MNDHTPPAILVEDVSQRYGDVQALDDVRLVAPAGQVCGLLGPNGAELLGTIVPLRPSALNPLDGRVHTGWSTSGRRVAG